MTEILRATNGAANGTTATLGNTEATQLSPGTPPGVTWATAKFGQTGLRFVNAGNTQNARFPLNAASNQAQFTFWYKTLAALPSANFTAFAARHSSGRAFSVLEATNGAIIFSPATGASSTILAAGTTTRSQWVAIQISATGASTTASTATVKAFNEAGTQLGSTLNATAQDFTANNISAFDLSSGSIAGDMMIYGVRANDGAGSPLAPYEPAVELETPVVTVTDHTNPTTVGGSNGTITIEWDPVDGADRYEAAIAEGVVTSGFSASDIDATSPHVFTGVEAGEFTVAVRAIAVVEVPFLGMLDGYAAPHRAHSLRRLLTSYTGPAIRVRRSSDNAETDIGFTTAGTLDTTALLAHCGANSGYVTTWYDQSGNTRHLTQTTTASQPRIVNAGTIDTINGKPAVKLDGTDDILTSTGVGLWAAGATSMCIVMQSATPGSTAVLVNEVNSADNNQYYRIMRSSTAAWHIQANANPGGALWASSTGGGAMFDGTAHQGFFVDASGATSTWRDGTLGHNAVATVHTGTLVPNRFQIGAGGGTTLSSYSAAAVAEVILWATNRTSDRAALSTNQKDFWGTP